MDEPFFTRPGEGERIRQQRVLAELPHIEALELFFPADRLLNFHTPNAGFIERLRG
jgi:hypothetical protein